LIGESLTYLTYLFLCGRALKLIRNGDSITNSSNPLILTKNMTLTVIDCCTPPPVRLVAHCIAAVAVIVAFVTSPNPIIVGSAINLVTNFKRQLFFIFLFKNPIISNLSSEYIFLK